MNAISAKSLYDAWSTEIECIEIIDVRSKKSFQKARVPGANWIFPQDLKTKLRQSNPNNLVVIVGDADQIDLTNEFENVVLLDGGMSSWLDKKYPSTQG